MPWILVLVQPKNIEPVVSENFHHVESNQHRHTDDDHFDLASLHARDDHDHADLPAHSMIFADGVHPLDPAGADLPDLLPLPTHLLLHSLPTTLHDTVEHPRAGPTDPLRTIGGEAPHAMGPGQPAGPSGGAAQNLEPVVSAFFIMPNPISIGILTMIISI